MLRLQGQGLLQPARIRHRRLLLAAALYGPQAAHNDQPDRWADRARSGLRVSARFGISKQQDCRKGASLQCSVNTSSERAGRDSHRGCNRDLMSFEDKSRGRRSEIAEAIVGGVTCGRWSTIGDLRRALVKFDAIRKVRVEDAIKMIDFVLSDPS